MPPVTAVPLVWCWMTAHHLAMQCHNHPDHVSDASCASCLKPICTLCMSTRGFEPTCENCANEQLKKQRKRAAVKAVVASVAALGVCAGIVVLVLNVEPTFDYGPQKWEVARLRDALDNKPCDKALFIDLLEVMTTAGDSDGAQKQSDIYAQACGPLPWTPWLAYDYGTRLPEVKRLADALEKEPCDKGRLVKLLDQMVGAQDYRGTLQRADAFFARCGDFPRARWLTYAAHKYLSEYDAAAAEATKLIDSDRYDRDFWWWRGNVWFLKGDWDKALADYQEVHKLCPQCTVGWQIADTLDKLGRPCEGIKPLKQVAEHNPDAGDIDHLLRRIATLEGQPACGGKPGSPSGAESTTGHEKGRRGGRRR